MNTVGDPCSAGPTPECGQPGQPCESAAMFALSPNRPADGILPPPPTHVSLISTPKTRRATNSARVPPAGDDEALTRAFHEGTPQTYLRIRLPLSLPPFPQSGGPPRRL